MFIESIKTPKIWNTMASEEREREREVFFSDPKLWK
jgi:hypothetical protein